METSTLILIIFGTIAVALACVVLVYLIALTRRTNIVMKKIDYLVEDITYKSESLNITVEAINKLSSYALSFEAVTKKGLLSLVKKLGENRNLFYSFFEKLKLNVSDNKGTKKAKSSKTNSTNNKQSTTKSTIKPKTTIKNTPPNNQNKVDKKDGK